MPSLKQITTAISMIDQLSGWLENAGLDQVAIVQFKFNSLAVMYPELKEVAEIAKSAIGSAFPITEEGMTVTELANIITENLGKSIKPARVNKALVELGYQERNDAKRTWSLTEAGKEHGICLLATSAKNSWSGVQVKWHRSVISVLLNYFQENLEESNSYQIRVSYPLMMGRRFIGGHRFGCSAIAQLRSACRFLQSEKKPVSG